MSSAIATWCGDLRYQELYYGYDNKIVLGDSLRDSFFDYKQHVFNFNRGKGKNVPHNLLDGIVEV